MSYRQSGIFLRRDRRRLGGGYASAVTGPIAYWPLDEGSGAVAHCLVDSAQNGTATGVTWADDATGRFGTPAPYFDGANDYINIYTAALAAAFSGVAGTSAVWCRVFNVGVWTDAASHYATVNAVDGNNQVYTQKLVANNQLEGRYVAGAVAESVIINPISSTDWFHIAVTWDKNAGATGEMKLYRDGVQSGATQDNLGVWVGALHANYQVIGAGNVVPAGVWHGWLAQRALWTRALTAPEILALANP